MCFSIKYQVDSFKGTYEVGHIGEMTKNIDLDIYD